MPRHRRLQFAGAIYHVLSRGVEKSNIFYDREDHVVFISYLEKFCEKFCTYVHSYCLMYNHFHLILETKNANLSRFMQRVLGDYAMYFNYKYSRVGHLFQGRYKSYLVDTEVYLLVLSRYIHLNPCEAGIVNSPEEYEWSSMMYYLSNKDGKTYLEKRLIMKYFKVPKQYHEFVLSGLNGTSPG